MIYGLNIVLLSFGILLLWQNLHAEDYQLTDTILKALSPMGNPSRNPLANPFLPES